MSPCPDRVRRIARRLRECDGGFGMVEVLVAFVLLALAAAAVIPVFVVGGRAAVTARFETQARNLGQERLERMRQLPVHVSRANGAYIDLLDHYYPNRLAATGTGTGFVTTGPRLTGEPTSGPMYRVVFPPTAAQPRFTQVVATQFLDLSRVAVPESRFSSYDSQVAGRDEPPSRFLGVTIITTWTDGTAAKRAVITSQITAAGRTQTVLTSQARAVALRMQSTAADGAAMTAEIARSAVDGQLSDAAIASAQAAAGRITKVNTSAVDGAAASAVAPGGAQPGQVNKDPVNGAGSGCGYGSLGRSQVDKVTSSVTPGYPIIPALAGGGTAPVERTTARLRADTGTTCGAFSFNNDTGNSDATLRLDGNAPLAYLRGSVAGDPSPAQATAWTTATDETANPRFVRAGAEGTTAHSIELFRTTFSGGQPLLWIRLVDSQITCDSRTPGAASASYRVLIDYRDVTGLRINLADLTWSSTTGPATDPLAGIDLSTKVVYDDGTTRLTLANYVASWSSGRTLSQGATNGLASLDGALQMTTVPVRAADPTSSAGITLGVLSCAATDIR